MLSALPNSYRIVIDIQENSKEIILLNIGSHDEVY